MGRFKFTAWEIYLWSWKARFLQPDLARFSIFMENLKSKIEFFRMQLFTNGTRTFQNHDSLSVRNQPTGSKTLPLGSASPRVQLGSKRPFKCLFFLDYKFYIFLFSFLHASFHSLWILNVLEGFQQFLLFLWRFWLSGNILLLFTLRTITV